MRIPGPENVQLVGDEVAIRWEDGREDYFLMEELRAASPSAEMTGERDLLGRVQGGDSRSAFPGVRVTGWQFIGGYAIRFVFSDGHQTGLYSYEYLRRLGGA